MKKASPVVSDQTSSSLSSSSSSSRELLVDLRAVGRGRLGVELERQLRAAIRSGRLRPGAQLPSSRALAADLGVSRSVVVQAFDQLAAEGYLTTRPGAVPRVSDVAARRAAQPGEEQPAAPARLGDGDRSQPPAPPDPAIDLRPGSPNLAGLPRAEWGRAVRRALATLTDGELGYGDSRGLPRLREALADYLGRVRGAIVDPDHLVVVNGFAQGLVVVARLLHDLGITGIGVEDPGSIHTSAHLADHGLTTVPVPVDDQGADIDAVPPGWPPGGSGGGIDRAGADSGWGRLRAVLVTPAHQFPTGAVLSPARRIALVEWAERNDGLVVEDDYDAEYRYDHHAVGALQGMAPDRVILGGSVSKTLAPGLRLGWLVVPPALAGEAARHKRSIDLMAPVLEQAALAELITSGNYERHIRRSRALYERRRDVVVETVAGELPEAQIVGASAGLHVLVTIPSIRSIPSIAGEAAVEQEAARRGVQVIALSHHRHRPGRPASPPASHSSSVSPTSTGPSAPPGAHAPDSPSADPPAPLGASPPDGLSASPGAPASDSPSGGPSASVGSSASPASTGRSASSGASDSEGLPGGFVSGGASGGSASAGPAGQPGRTRSADPGFVLAYGHLTEDQLRRAVKLFAGAVRLVASNGDPA